MNAALLALAGGSLIGLAASILMLFNGRIAGISGIYGSLLKDPHDAGWRLAFVGGLLLAGVGVALLAPGLMSGHSERSLPLVALAGLLVGVGVRLGSEAAFEGGRPILGHAPLHANVSQALDLFNRNFVGPFRCTSVCAYLFIAIGFTLSRDPAAELGEAWHVTALRYSGITVFVLSRTGDTLL